ncbi:heterochromatin protein (macronuclear) [Tetrahymena thermophila SB210]|uniref:Heterochromatin protein n=2 Tax=Tetrahymena thermophila TaxID=5911 RepID=I7LU69_TETTS|nr:heterochromatin protein [Tetrahymena thermophila SB210]AAC78328.1 heterochromatin-associated protein 1-like protein [Tetrahymena thermophila]EAR90708.3 heterochromatin protein [Tetrahymena thermophila SB210]|eukprot:XP_001010953.3 heterochromatin protein [Tetrahymena thermophila SB210]
MTKVYEVENIIGHRKKGSQIEYHIQWKGYSLKQATYEPAKNILDKNMLKKYQQKHLLSNDKPQTPIKKSIKKGASTHQTRKSSSTTKRSVKKSVEKASNPKSTPKLDKKALDPVKEIHNYQKDVSKLLLKSDITSILHVFKDDGKSLYTVTIGKHPKQYLVSSSQIAKYASPDLIVRFYEKLIR